MKNKRPKNNPKQNTRRIDTDKSTIPLRKGRDPNERNGYFEYDEHGTL